MFTTKSVVLNDLVNNGWGKRMTKEANIKSILINNAIHLIAEGGFEKATTKNLAHYEQAPKNVKMNEVYIYRLFGSKEALYQAAFLVLDRELVEAFTNALTISGELLLDTKKKLYNFFLMVWQFILKNEEHCRCYIRYYYSIYFKSKALEKHRQHFDSIVNSFNSLFIEEADVKSIMHSVFTTLLDFAIRVYNGELADDEINRPHIFNVLYCMMMTYLKHPEKENFEALLI